MKDARKRHDESWNKLKAHYNPTDFDSIPDGTIPALNKVKKRKPLVENEAFQMVCPSCIDQ